MSKKATNSKGVLTRDKALEVALGLIVKPRSIFNTDHSIRLRLIDEGLPTDIESVRRVRVAKFEALEYIWRRFLKARGRNTDHRKEGNL